MMSFRRSVPFAALALLLAAAPAIAEEPDARTPGSSVVIAGTDEPGERLHLAGTVFADDGETPVAGAELYVYHTDARGYYSGETTSSANPRLKATLQTDAEGRYEISTIRPGAYPGGGVPAHVHFVITADGFKSEQRHDLHFEGDPQISESTVERSRRLGRFGGIRPLAKDEDGVWHCVRDFRLRR